MAEDYYTILGVERSATKADIKRAYRKLAHKHHPDKSGGDEEKFKQVNAAYQVLSDDQKRAQYDQHGQNFDGAQGPEPGGFNFNPEDLGGFGDIFEQFFGGAGRSRGGRQVRRGDDVAIDITIDFITSAEGVTQQVTTQLQQPCQHCKGSGAEPHTPIKECSTCRGAGSIARQQQTMFGVFAQQVICPDCHGEGKKAEKPCRDCRGEGRVRQARTLQIEIPAGIADGQTLRLSGKGEAPPRGGVMGDLYVTVHVKAHPQMKRDENDVRVTAVVSMADAALGTKIKIPTLKGAKQVAVAAGIQPGGEVVLEGEGFPSLRTGRRGDQVVTIQVEVPRKLSHQQKKLLEEFRKAPTKGFFA